MAQCRGARSLPGTRCIPRAGLIQAHGVHQRYRSSSRPSPRLTSTPSDLHSVLSSPQRVWCGIMRWQACPEALSTVFPAKSCRGWRPRRTGEWRDGRVAVTQPRSPTPNRTECSRNTSFFRIGDYMYREVPKLSNVAYIQNHGINSLLNHF